MLNPNISFFLYNHTCDSLIYTLYTVRLTTIPVTLSKTSVYSIFSVLISRNFSVKKALSPFFFFFGLYGFFCIQNKCPMVLPLVCQKNCVPVRLDFIEGEGIILVTVALSKNQEHNCEELINNRRIRAGEMDQRLLLFQRS